MELLFHLAEREALRQRGDRARRYVDLAQRIGMRYNVHMPPRLKRRFCKQCHAYLIPPANARVRVARGRVTTTCLQCGAVERIPYVRERGERRRGTRRPPTRPP